MPTYVYKCKNCGKIFDISGSLEFLSNYEPICPDCYGENIRRLYTPFGIILKGNGFYKNDSTKEQ